MRFSQFSGFLAKEMAHFRTLGPAAQRLLLSSGLYACAEPLMFVFVNAFIWRKTADITAAGMYNLGTFCTLPLCFFINGFMLKKVGIKRLFSIGLIGQGLAALTVFFLQAFSYRALFLLGAIQGIPMGFYWANRNYITQVVTQDEHRNYYASLETVLGTLAGIVVPILVGWFIVTGELLHWYSTDFAYRLLVVFTTCLLAVAAFSFQAQTLSNPVISRLGLKKISPTWWRARVTEVCWGFYDRMNSILPSLLIISFIGNEGILGSLQSLLGVAMVVAVYLLGRRLKTAHRFMVIACAVGVFSVNAILLSLFFTKGMIILFAIVMPLCQHFIWGALSPLQMKRIDDEEDGDPTNNYAYVADRELFLNIGRILGMTVFFGVIFLSSQNLALRFAPLTIAAAQMLLLKVVRQK